MYVILDTNVIVADWWMSKQSFAIFKEAIDPAGIKLCIPRVVILELRKCFGEALESSLSDLTKASRNVSAMLRRSPLKVNVDVDYESWRYVEILERDLANLGGEVIELPSATHLQVISRVLDGRRPFTKKDMGYKDCLVWESIVDFAKVGRAPIAFITDDTDFWMDSRPHPDLLADLRSIASAEFMMFKHIGAFNDHFIAPTLDELISLRDSVIGDHGTRFLNDIRDVYADSALEALREQGAYLILGAFPSFTFTGPYWNEPPVVELLSVRRLPSSKHVLDFEFRGNASIGFELNAFTATRPEVQARLSVHTAMGNTPTFERLSNQVAIRFRLVTSLQDDLSPRDLASVVEPLTKAVRMVAPRYSEQESTNSDDAEEPENEA